MQPDGILRKLESSEKDAVDIMCRMVGIPAMSPYNGGDGECARADYLQTCLKGFDSVERYDLEDPSHPGTMRANVIARKKGKKKGTFWLITHMDTVPPGDLEDWNSPPFEARVADGKIYGRGTEDNGQSLVGTIIAGNAVCGEEFGGMSLAVAFVADEETGSFCGIKHLIDLGMFSRDDFILVPDWGAPGGAMVDVAEKQILWIKTEVTGKQTHGSTPNKGINAFRAATEFLSDLMKRLEERYPAHNDLFRINVSTFEPTRASANTGSVNMIPGYYEFFMDCRVLPEYDLDEITEFMRSVAAEHAARTGAEIKVIVKQHAVSGKPSDTDRPEYRIFEDSVRAVIKTDVKAVGIGGGTCANFFRLEGMDAYAWGSDGGTLHQPNEYVVISTLMRDAKVFALAMYNLCVKG